jgi:hypothetical protein
VLLAVRLHAPAAGLAAPARARMAPRALSTPDAAGERA